MSKTAGVTAAPPVYGTPLMFTLIPPVEAYCATPCNWYCHRALRAGCQHAPCCVLHGTGAGGVAWADRGTARPTRTSPITAMPYRTRSRMGTSLSSIGSRDDAAATISLHPSAGLKRAPGCVWRGRVGPTGRLRQACGLLGEHGHPHVGRCHLDIRPSEA